MKESFIIRSLQRREKRKEPLPKTLQKTRREIQDFDPHRRRLEGPDLVAPHRHMPGILPKTSISFYIVTFHLTPQ